MKPKYIIFENENGFEIRQDFNEAASKAASDVMWLEKLGIGIDSAGYPQLEELTGVIEIQRQIIRDLIPLIESRYENTEQDWSAVARARAAISEV